jgi:hypothetical protein
LLPYNSSRAPSNPVSMSTERGKEEEEGGRGEERC